MTDPDPPRGPVDLQLVAGHARGALRILRDRRQHGDAVHDPDEVVAVRALLVEIARRLRRRGVEPTDPCLGYDDPNGVLAGRRTPLPARPAPAARQGGGSK